MQRRRSGISVVVLVTVLASSALAQVLTEQQVPAAVIQGFHAKFPAAQHAAWKLKSDKNYEAEFTLHAAEIAAKFDSTGKWLETESAIPRSRVPKAVLEVIARQLPAYRIIETQTLQRWNEERTIYELHLQNASEVLKLQFSADGTILEKSAKPAKSSARH